MLNSKLPATGTTIFSVMTALSIENKAINLSQGFPDFAIDPELADLVDKAIREGNNQYAPMPGLLSLRNGISENVKNICDREIDPDKEITVTSGATEALFAAISVIVKPGDEVIMFDPAYDSYEPAVILNGGIPVHIPLTFPEFAIDWNKVNDAVNSRTRLIILNSPNNPSGSVITEDDIIQLKKIISSNDIYILSDEVYEHIIFDGRKHLSMILDDQLYQRSFIVSSFGKTFHITGWKVGYCIAPADLTSEFRKVHQFLTFSTSTPFQAALTVYLKNIKRINDLKSFYQNKRDTFLKLISETKFIPLNCSGTYFQLLDYSAISDEPDVDFAVRFTKENKVASIPVSVFYKERQDNKVLRFCFAKEDETLRKAVSALAMSNEQ
ncbi:MAG: aminotransferase class I/II-fold pyridoxal phosphate-dependent enzyme [Ignavibacteria bacterium]|nr:aminotransferase class I/II-fold pyridoxal phosphate-dependent enzyme [Ignavibacteria bacterium]